MRSKVHYIGGEHRSNIGVSFLVQTDYEVDIVRQEILQFIDTFRDNLALMKEKTFQNFKKNIMNNLRIAFKNIYEELNSNFKQLLYSQNIVDEKEIKLKIISNISKNELIQSYHKYFVNEPSFLITSLKRKID